MATITTQVTETQGTGNSSSESKYARHSYYCTAQDYQDLAELSDNYGFASDSEAIRFLIRTFTKGKIEIHIDGHSLPIGYQAR